MSDSREHLLKFLASGTRFDGRKLGELRPVAVRVGVSKNAEGSAHVAFGSTEVLAGVKMGVEQPYPDTPDNGNLMVNAELLPLSNPDFEAGPPGEESVEVARIIDRGIRESKVIDTKSLCISPREKVWSVMIDAVTMNTDGNVIDAAALASVAALKNARMPEYADGAVNYKKLTGALPLSGIPITVTIVKIGPYLLADPVAEEEELADARLTAAITPDGRICALQKGGDSPLGADDIDGMLRLALEKSKELAKKL